MTESTPSPESPDPIENAPEEQTNQTPTIESSSEERTLAMLAHLLAIVGWFLAPLIIWLIKKDESKFIDDQGKEALNFQLTLLIGWAIVVLATCLTACLGGFGALLVLPLQILNIVFSVLAGLAANQGQQYRYPFNIRFIK